MSFPLEVIYEDNRIIAVSKPAGQLVIPGRTEEEGEPLIKTIQKHLNEKPLIVHRIDKATSGLVLFAKDKDAQRKISFLFENRKIDKNYRALVLGEVRDDGEIDEPLRVFGSGRTGVDAGGKESLTRYKILKRLKGATLLHIVPKTGRRHQIRAHLNHIGHPILGDPRYGERSRMKTLGNGGRSVGGVARLMLHARGMRLPGFSKEPLKIAAEPGDDFNAIVDSY